MKNNCLGVLFGVFFLSFSPLLFALGLGGITTDSALNEPLIAEIELVNVGELENTEILVSIGTESDYALAGVTKEYFHSDLQFEVQAEGADRPRILVRTRSPLEDPYLNFIVQVRWPQGKLLREYTLLLDMPVFSKQEAPKAVETVSQSPPPPLTARQASEQQSAGTAPRSQQPSIVRTQAAPRAQTTTTQQSPNVSRGGEYRVSEGDTLWRLAGAASNSAGITRHQAMLAIHEQNIDAFVNGDINRLKAGAVLSVPSESQMSGRSADQALRDFASLASETSATPLRAVENDFRNTGSDASNEPNGRLALVSANSNDVGGALDASNNELDASLVAEQEETLEALATTTAENTVLKEELDAATVQNEELAARVANLEEQLELTQNLLTDAAFEVETDIAAIDDQTVVEPELAVAEEEVIVEEVEEQPTSAAEGVVVRAQAEPETLIDRLMRFLPWILIGLAVVVVIGLLVVFLVLKSRKSSQVDELLADEDYEDDYEDQAYEDEGDGEETLLHESESDDLDEDDDYLDDEDQDDDEEGFDEIDKNLPQESSDEPEEDESEDEGEELVDEEPLFASSFEEAEDDELFDSDEFEDLDEFFKDSSGDAADVLFGSEGEQEELETDEPEASPDADEPEAGEAEDTEDNSLEFSATDLADFGEDASEESDGDDAELGASSDAEDENELEFDISDFAPDEDAEETPVEEDTEIDLENSFEFTESDISEDLSPAAEAEFEESLELHSSEIDDLLVPSEEGIEESDDDELFVEEPADSLEDSGLESELGQELDQELEEFDEELEDLLDEDDQSSADSVLDLDEDLNLDEDMDADLEGLDLGSGDEEFVTQLELAEAYIEMGDVQGAKELLSEVIKDGNEEQKAAAEALLQSAKV